MMTENLTTSSPPPKMENISPTPSRTTKRLRKRFLQDDNSSPSILGVKIKRFSEFENYSGRSRGTLGGFSPLPEMGSPEVDNLSLEKQSTGEKECILTQLTKKIGLGIYTRGRETITEKNAREGYIDPEGDERETWYMFYPPPPSPSLALEPKAFDSNSSLDPETDTSSPSSVPVIVSEVVESPSKEPPKEPPNEPPNEPPKEQARLSNITTGSHYVTSNPTSPTSPTELAPFILETKPDMDIDALILSAEHLAEQYRGLLLNPDTTPRLVSSYPRSENGRSPLPFPSPLTLHPLIRSETPKTLRKIKRQHSLRKLVDDGHAYSTSTSTIDAHTPITPPSSSWRSGDHMTLPPFTALTSTKIPVLLTPPPSATKPPPLTPLTPQPVPLPPSLRSPDFLNTETTPQPVHPTRLSMAAHPNRSPTPSQHHRPQGGSQRIPKEKRKQRRNVSQPPDPLPRQSSRVRQRGSEEKGEGNGKGKRAASLGGDARRVEPRKGSIRNADRRDGERRGRARQRQEGSTPMRHDAVDMVNVGGEGWL